VGEGWVLAEVLLAGVLAADAVEPTGAVVAVVQPRQRCVRAPPAAHARPRAANL
jgi:hypothetical protein